IDQREKGSKSGKQIDARFHGVGKQAHGTCERIGGPLQCQSRQSGGNRKVDRQTRRLGSQRRLSNRIRLISGCSTPSCASELPPCASDPFRAWSLPCTAHKPACALAGTCRKDGRLAAGRRTACCGSTGSSARSTGLPG